MKKSKKQTAKDRELSRAKSSLERRCVICGGWGDDLAHLLPKSLFPEHYTEPLNLVIMCRRCHRLHDDNLEFRKKQTKLFKQASQFDKLGAGRYYKIES